MSNGKRCFLNDASWQLTLKHGGGEGEVLLELKIGHFTVVCLVTWP